MLIVNGVDCARGLECRSWDEHGMRFVVGDPGTRRRAREIDLGVVHWNGADGGAKATYRVLRNRRLASEFFIDHDGVLWQFADPGEVDTYDAGKANSRSWGVEMSNVGTGAPKKRWPREIDRVELHGRRMRIARYYPAQIKTLQRLCEWSAAEFGHPLRVPEDARGALITRTLTPLEYQRYTGLLGHFHLTPEKNDPGPKILEQLQSAWRKRAAA